MSGVGLMSPVGVTLSNDCLDRECVKDCLSSWLRFCEIALKSLTHHVGGRSKVILCKSGRETVQITPLAWDECHLPAK